MYYKSVANCDFEFKALVGQNRRLASRTLYFARERQKPRLIWRTDGKFNVLGLRFKEF